MVPPIPAPPAYVRRASSSSDSDSSASLAADTSPKKDSLVRRRTAPDAGLKASAKADAAAEIVDSDPLIMLERKPSMPTGKAAPSEVRKSLATAAVFVASGVMHEIIFW